MKVAAPLKLSTLAQNPELRSPCLQLIERTFPRGEVLSVATPIATEFALLLDPSNAARQVIGLVNNQVVATASYRIFYFQTPYAADPIAVAGVGAVVTAVPFQRQGYGRQILQELERLALTENAFFAVLWSDQQKYYESQNYMLAGLDKVWSLAALNPETPNNRARASLAEALPPGITIELCQDISKLQTLYNLETSGPERNFKDYLHYLNLSDTEILVAQTLSGHTPTAKASFDQISVGKTSSDQTSGDHIAGGQISSGHPSTQVLAYAVCGKARDLRAVVHEIVGDAKYLAPLLNTQLARSPGASLQVHYPAQGKNLAALEKLLGKSQNQALAYFKLLQAPKFIDWLNRSSYLPSSVQIEIAKGFSIRQNAQVIFQSEDFAHLTQLFLGPWKISEMEGLPPALMKAFSTQPILELYFWGFDSV